jgi:hypothetical protein
MKKLLILLSILSMPALSENKEIHPEKNYLCVKGDTEILYKISYREQGKKVPCKVLEKYSGQELNEIAFSQITINVCEEVIQKILARCKSQGMKCEEVE